MADSRARSLSDVVVRVGSVLMFVGLVMFAAIIVLYVLGKPLPGTWAYLVVMLAPIGVALMMGWVAAALLGRRRLQRPESHT